MIRRLHARKLFKKATLIDKTYAIGLDIRLRKKVNKNAFASVAVVDIPGSGESFFNRRVNKEGFLSFDTSEIFTIDDLMDVNRKRYTVKELKKLNANLKRETINII